MHTLAETLEHPSVHVAIAHAANFTKRTGQEAAFAVYNDTDRGLETSQVLKGWPEDDGKGPWSGSVEAAVKRYTSLDVGPVVNREGRFRTDVTAFFHTHGVFADHGQRVQDALCPSTVDLELSAEFELASPGRVDGIIVPVPKRAIASLLLYRRGDHPLVPYYETVEKVPTFPRVVDFLKQCGLVAASVDFDLRKKEYLNGWRDQITSLSFGGEQ